MPKKTLYVAKIRNGTVIDHITAGHAMDVAKILGIAGRTNGGIVTIAMNVASKKLGKKDMVKIEGRELNPDEVDKIALLAPHASINIIRNYEVIEKKEVKLPRVLKGIIKCANPACISNSDEPVQPKFYVESEEPLSVKCHYCGYIMEKQDILKQF
ncbi:MAG: aspartate carbamoyltransferase regulatory subunit [Candidatus Bathyarchaeia archaeon]|jgi:aspartate carbamoyltransferase regulatory subunit|nr:aspartate carbamoyltransferase regulatory subunit [Candidatus Bathyarchaeota archaeon A05DMB-4]MDH7595702.1 aspartate carbamoyltransferase regulatory subunit [Candidatus Bathyarchaeota archaeon]